MPIDLYELTLTASLFAVFLSLSHDLNTCAWMRCCAIATAAAATDTLAVMVWYTNQRISKINKRVWQCDVKIFIVNRALLISRGDSQLLYLVLLLSVSAFLSSLLNHIQRPFIASNSFFLNLSRIEAPNLIILHHFCVCLFGRCTFVRTSFVQDGYEYQEKENLPRVCYGSLKQHA